MKRIVILSFLLIVVLVCTVLAAEKQATVTPQTQSPPGIQAILEPAKLTSAKLSEYLPKLGGLLLILAVGSLIALGVTALVSGLLDLIRLEKGAKKINIPEILKKGGIGLSLSELITEIIFFLIVVATLITALEYYGVSTTAFTAGILVYIPQVVACVFILLLGILLAILISGIITLVGGNIKIAQSALLANIAKYAIIIFTTLIALKELGLGIILTDKSKDIILAGLALSLALSFGLAGRERAEKYLNKILKQ